MESGVSDLRRRATQCDGTAVSTGFTVSFRKHPDSRTSGHLGWSDFYKSSRWPVPCLQSSDRNLLTVTGVIVIQTFHCTNQCIVFTLMFYKAIVNLFEEVVKILHVVILSVATSSCNKGTPFSIFCHKLSDLVRSKLCYHLCFQITCASVTLLKTWTFHCCGSKSLCLQETM